MNIAVVCASGIGDALITSIASHHLHTLGHTVTTFHRHLPSFGRWLEPGSYQPLEENALSLLHSFDAVLLQHDNTPKAYQIVSLRKTGLPIYVFYTTYRETKHGPLLSGFDIPFDPKKTMVENTCQGVSALFGQTASLQNSLSPPPGLIHRKYNRRILLHPTSGDPNKNWLKSRYIRLATRLETLGFHPLFLLSPKERGAWPMNAPLLPTLEDLASFIYESDGFIGNDSGPSHLASYLSIPHLTLRPNRQTLWIPGWHSGEHLMPSRWIPNIKGFRLRDQKWQYFITTRTIENKFKHTIAIKNDLL